MSLHLSFLSDLGEIFLFLLLLPVVLPQPPSLPSPLWFFILIFPPLLPLYLSLSFLFFKEFICLWETQRERGREIGRWSSRLHVGFDPGSPRSHPGPKAGTKPLHHPGTPVCWILSLTGNQHLNKITLHNFYLAFLDPGFPSGFVFRGRAHRDNK